MTQVRAFLERAVPWPSESDPVGFVNCHWHLPGRPFRGQSVQSIDDFLAVADSLENANANLYFCLSRQAENGGTRNKENALDLSSLWWDVDVELGNPKKYDTFEDALAATQECIEHRNLPSPSALVHSGNGLHVYWFSDRPLTYEEWLPYAEGLKQVALDSGLRCDAGITADAARVLRIPGTKNFKSDPPRPVRLLGMQDTRYDFRDVFAAFKAERPAARRKNSRRSEFVGEIASAFRGHKAESLSAGLEKEDALIPLKPCIAECPFIKEAFATGGKDYNQPAWMYTTLLSTWMEDGDELAHLMANQHVGYSHESTDAMLVRKKRERDEKDLGWPSCRAIAASPASACGSCKYRDAGKSPLHFATARAQRDAERAAPANKLSSVAANTQRLQAADNHLSSVGADRSGFGVHVPPDAGPPGDPFDDLQLPNGYCLDERGKVCRIGQTKKEPPLIQLFHDRLVRGAWIEGGEEPAVHFRITLDKGREKDCSVPVTKFGITKLQDWLHQEQVNFVPENSKYLGGFMAAWLDKMREAREAIQTSAFGWICDEAGTPKGFTYAGKTYRADGTVHPAGWGDRRIAPDYRPAGLEEKWWEAYRLVSSLKRSTLDIIVSSAFAAPLMHFTGCKGALISVWGTSGSTKSSASRVAAAVFGHPLLTRESIGSTHKGTIHRLGCVRNLSVHWDDLTNEHEVEVLAKTAHQATQGMENTRLNSNIEMQKRGWWSTLLVSCSNVSFCDTIVKKQPTHAAGLNRVLEMEFNKEDLSDGLIDHNAAMRINGELDRHYGHIGVKYISRLAVNHAYAKNLLEKTEAQFKKMVSENMEDRFWTCAISTVLTGALLANEWVGTEFDVPAMFKRFAEVYEQNSDRRKKENIIGGTKENTEAALAQILKYYMGNDNVLWTGASPKVGGSEPGTHTVKLFHGPGMTSGHKREVHAQFVVDERLLLVHTKSIKHYLEVNKIPPRSVLLGLERHFNAENKRRRLGAGTEYVVLLDYVYVIPVPEGSALEELMLLHAK